MLGTAGKTTHEIHERNEGVLCGLVSFSGSFAQFETRHTLIVHRASALHHDILIASCSKISWARCGDSLRDAYGAARCVPVSGVSLLRRVPSSLTTRAAFCCWSTSFAPIVPGEYRAAFWAPGNSPKRVCAASCAKKSA